MSNALDVLLERYPERVRAALNVLVEGPYFYRTDDEDLFFFIRRHRQQFAEFYEAFYGWTLVMDEKCARVHKQEWYNAAITEVNRDLFNFRRRDDCIGFMILLEFFENELEENSMTVEDHDNPRFYFGDLLRFTHRRFGELFPGDAGERYTEEFVRANVLRRILPVLERYRLLTRLRPPADMAIAKADDMIFEAMPALYHYNAARLSRGIDEDGTVSVLPDEDDDVSLPMGTEEDDA